MEIIENKGGPGQIIRSINEETGENEIVFAGFFQIMQYHLLIQKCFSPLFN